MRSRLHRDEHGWVMVPVMVLLVVALGLGFALVALADTQTSQGHVQRASDAAQTLAEGVVTATSTVLASDPSSAAWPTTGACQTMTGTVGTASAAAAGSLAARVASEVTARFSGSATGATWRVDLCPVAGTAAGTSWTQDAEARWSDAFLSRAITAQPAGLPPRQLSVWLRGQARVTPATGTTRVASTRAVATKVRQARTLFTPPTGFAVGTGSFSTELTTTLGTLSSDTSLVGSLTSSVLGTKPLIADSTSKIGVRCGLLNTLNNPSSVCLSGTLSGVNGSTNALGLGTLNTLLGTNRSETLATWTMAPADALAAWKAEAQRTGVYKATVAGAGSTTTKTGAATAPECFTDATSTSSVVWIGKVGDGSQYCTVSAASGRSSAKILIVEQGGVRITGAFTGVVLALNTNECTNADGTCSTADRTGAPLREVVRIEGPSGSVTGSVWADGAGGTVGIYPALTQNNAGASSLLGNLCSMPLVGPVLSTLGSTLTGVGNLLGQTLNLLGNVQEQVRYPDSGNASTGCQALTASLNQLTGTQQLQLFADGGAYSVPVSEHRTRTCTSALLSIGCGAWSAWTTKDTQTVQFPALTSDVVGALTATLTGYTAIRYDGATVTNASATLTAGAGPVPGTYRNTPPL